MSSAIRSRAAAFVLAAVVVALLPAASKAAPIGAFDCFGQGRFTGHLSPFLGIDAWNWEFSGGGTCVRATTKFDLTILANARGYEFPGPKTLSPKEPWTAWSVTVVLKSGAGQRTFHHVWYGFGGQGPFRMHTVDPTIPHPELAVGGQVGLGVNGHGGNVGTYTTPIIKTKYVFTFGTDPLPIPALPV